MLKVRLKLHYRFMVLIVIFKLVYALYNMAYSIGMFVGPVVAGLIMSASGFETLMIVFSSALILCSPIMLNWGAVYRKAISLFSRN